VPAASYLTGSAPAAAHYTAVPVIPAGLTAAAAAGSAVLSHG